MKEKTLSKIIIIFLAVVLAAMGALAAFVYVSNQRLEKELRSIRREIDDIDTAAGDDTAAQLALLSGALMEELEGTIEGVTADISAQISEQMAEQIGGVEEALSKYDDDIASISSSLEELNENMVAVSKVIVSLQEILDSIKDFLKIS